MPTRDAGPLPWAVAWDLALYGPDGFFTTGAGPAAHFRTAVHAAPGPLAAAVARLARELGCSGVLDVGAGRGELLRALAAAPEATGLALHGVDVVGRPPGLPDAAGWSAGLAATPAHAFRGALVVAWELLDDVPCPVLEVDDEGVPRTVLVDPATGVEDLGDPAADADLDWCRRWWPLDGAEEGDRAEVGRPRDDLWAGLVRRAAAANAGSGTRTALLAVDYSHHRADRPVVGSLTGYRAGRVVPPVPDGTVNVTAHVALDAVAAAGEAAGATTTRLTDQRTALLGLGLGARPGDLPTRDLPARDLPARDLPAGELADRLVERSQVAELLDPGSLGSFGWLLQTL